MTDKKPSAAPVKNLSGKQAAKGASKSAEDVSDEDAAAALNIDTQAPDSKEPAKNKKEKGKKKSSVEADKEVKTEKGEAEAGDEQEEEEDEEEEEEKFTDMEEAIMKTYVHILKMDFQKLDMTAVVDEVSNKQLNLEIILKTFIGYGLKAKLTDEKIHNYLHEALIAYCVGGSNLENLMRRTKNPVHLKVLKKTFHIMNYPQKQTDLTLARLATAMMKDYVVMSVSQKVRMLGNKRPYGWPQIYCNFVSSGMIPLNNAIREAYSVWCQYASRLLSPNPNYGQAVTSANAGMNSTQVSEADRAKILNAYISKWMDIDAAEVMFFLQQTKWKHDAVEGVAFYDGCVSKSKLLEGVPLASNTASEIKMWEGDKLNDQIGMLYVYTPGKRRAQAQTADSNALFMQFTNFLNNQKAGVNTGSI